MLPEHQNCSRLIIARAAVEPMAYLNNVLRIPNESSCPVNGNVILNVDFAPLTEIFELLHHKVCQDDRHELTHDIQYLDAAGGNPEVLHRGTPRHSRSKGRYDKQNNRNRTCCRRGKLGRRKPTVCQSSRSSVSTRHN